VAPACLRAGYSAKTAAEMGHENLIKPHVAEKIEKAQMKRAERAELNADWVIDELRKIADANMADCMKSTTHGDPYRDFFGTDA
jgi:phage terminase small subunit